ADGDAISSVGYTGNYDDLVNIPTEFTPSAHIHEIADVVGLEQIIENKADLDEWGKVLASQLPSYVDDVLEFDSLSDFPTVGEDGKIYVTLDTNLTYRWTGSDYIEISKSLALGETASTAYRGDR